MLKVTFPPGIHLMSKLLSRPLQENLHLLWRHLERPREMRDYTHCAIPVNHRQHLMLRAACHDPHDLGFLARGLERSPDEIKSPLGSRPHEPLPARHRVDRQYCPDVANPASESRSQFLYVHCEQLYSSHPLKVEAGWFNSHLPTHLLKLIKRHMGTLEIYSVKKLKNVLGTIKSSTKT